MKYTSSEGWSIDSANWAVNTLIRMYKRGEIDYNSKVQRDFVWTKKTSSKYIQSLFWGMLGYNIPQLYSKKGNIYYSIDGQQRSLTLIKYVNNEYPLVGLGNCTVNVDGVEHKINGKFFKQLDERLQEIFMDFQLNISLLENATESVEAEFFERANSGVRVSSKDVAFSKSVSKDEILELANHEIFIPMFPKQADKTTQRKEVVIKTYIAINETVPDYSDNHYKKVTSETLFEEDDITAIKSVYDKVLSAYKIILIQNPEIAKTIMRKTHFLSYIAFVERFEDPDQFAKWLMLFYKEPPEEYKVAATQQTTSLRHIKARVEVVKESVDKFLSNKNTEKYGLTRSAEYFKRKLDKDD